MGTVRGSLLLRHAVMGALFALSVSHSRPAMGYTMVVWDDPYDGWGCIGACGGWGDSSYGGDWSGSGEQSGGGGGAEYSDALPTVPEVWCNSDDEIKRAGACQAIMQLNPMAEPGDQYVIQFEDGTQPFKVISRYMTACAREAGPCVRD